MAFVRLIHWNYEEAEERGRRLESEGYEVEWEPPEATSYKQMRRDLPDAFVIDLTRLPSHGRELAMYLREGKRSRMVPIVFVEGEPKKVERIRQVLPDASFTSWRGIRGALRRALSRPVTNPVVPSDRMQGYSGTPLPKKLGIKEGMAVGLLQAPPDFEETLGSLPPDVALRRAARGKLDLIIWFPKSLRELEDRIDRIAERMGGGGLWIAWPKKASGVETDVDQTAVRRTGLAAGLVDYKICAIDSTWSGLRFARRKP